MRLLTIRLTLFLVSMVRIPLKQIMGPILDIRVFEYSMQPTRIQGQRKLVGDLGSLQSSFNSVQFNEFA
jgi:hypothetical protein